MNKELLKDLTILYVEDEAIISALISKSLRRAVKHVVQAQNGQEALSLYEKEKFDVIVTDINMPIMNGLTFIQKIRESDTIPVVITTGNSEKDYKDVIDSIDNITYMIKPIDIFTLLNNISEKIKAT